MQSRIRIPVPESHAQGNLIPLLESADLPGDDDWAILGPLRRDGYDDDDVEVSFHPDFD